MIVVKSAANLSNDLAAAESIELTKSLAVDTTQALSINEASDEDFVCHTHKENASIMTDLHVTRNHITDNEFANTQPNKNITTDYTDLDKSAANANDDQCNRSSLGRSDTDGADSLSGSAESLNGHLSGTRDHYTAGYMEKQTTEEAVPIYRVHSRTRRRTIYTAGRPPWYDHEGQNIQPLFIGICGGTASGKTTVSKKIIEALDVPWVVLLSMDSFYKVLDEQRHNLAAQNEYNFDHPDAFDFEGLIHVLKRLRVGKKAEVPIYNFVTHKREPHTRTIYGANVVIFEGIMSFYNVDVRRLLDIKVFVDTDDDVRLARRIRRDILFRGRSLKGVLQQYERFVKPAFDHYIGPMTAHADIIVPRGGLNNVAIGLIVQHANSQLYERRLDKSINARLPLSDVSASDGRNVAAGMSQLSSAESTAAVGCDQGSRHPSSLHVLPSTPQIASLHTLIRNCRISRDEFVFYSRRLMRLTIEFALSLLPYRRVCVDTPQGVSYSGVELVDSHSLAQYTHSPNCVTDSPSSSASTSQGLQGICGVSILRAGETMEQALTDVCQCARIGKMLIQTSESTGEPKLYYLRLPHNIKDMRVFLMDATVATGASAMMALRVLVDHDVSQDNIVLCSLLMAASGVHNIAYSFPRVRIVTSAVDPHVNEQYYVVPGIGNFGDRFYGTEDRQTSVELSSCDDES